MGDKAWSKEEVKWDYEMFGCLGNWINGVFGCLV